MTLYMHGYIGLGNSFSTEIFVLFRAILSCTQVVLRENMRVNKKIFLIVCMHSIGPMEKKWPTVYGS
jgi:hypothetical protein